MLLRKHGGRHQHSHLPAIHDSFEGCAQRYLGLAVTHIAAQQAIHGPRAFHVAFDLFDRPHLILGFRVRETHFQNVLPFRVAFKRVSMHGLTLGVKFQQIGCDFFNGFAHLIFDCHPIFPTRRWSACGSCSSGPMYRLKRSA